MNIFDLEFENFYTLSLSVNWLAILALFLCIFIFLALAKKVYHTLIKRSIHIDEVVLGIGNSHVKLKYNHKDQEIAYKLWVELNTRKIGLLFEEDYDVIKDVYDSWYSFFGIARELLKEVPQNSFLRSNDLIDLTTEVLNLGLRPHLTRWQAKFRKWYDAQQETNSEAPQLVQKKYPEYDALVKDLLATNKKMIEYKKLMYKIAFNK